MTAIKNKSEKEICDYNTYLKLKTLKFSNDYISKHLNYCIEHLGYLISTYTFTTNIEYQIESKKGNHKFNGQFYICNCVKHILTTEQIYEINNFIKDLVLQHNGIHHTQTFYCIENDCQLLCIDYKSHYIIKLAALIEI